MKEMCILLGETSTYGITSMLGSGVSNTKDGGVLLASTSWLLSLGDSDLPLDLLGSGNNFIFAWVSGLDCSASGPCSMVSKKSVKI